MTTTHGKEPEYKQQVAGPGCTLKKVLDHIGGKWKILILCSLNQNGSMRYGVLKRSVYGITNAMLSNSLRELQEDGFITRTVYTEMPLQVEYALSDRGHSIAPLLMELSKWGEDNL